MEGETGYSLLRKVRSLPRDVGGAVPAAALTAYSRTEDRVRALRAGFQMYMSKPVQPAELLAVVAALADLSAAGDPRSRRRGRRRGPISGRRSKRRQRRRVRHLVAQHAVELVGLHPAVAAAPRLAVGLRHGNGAAPCTRPASPWARARAASRATNASNVIGSGPTRSYTRCGGSAPAHRRPPRRGSPPPHPPPPPAASGSGRRRAARRRRPPSRAAASRTSAVAGPHDVRRAEDVDREPRPEQRRLRAQLGEEVAVGGAPRHAVMRDAEAAEEGDARDAGARRGLGHAPRALDVHRFVGVGRPRSRSARGARRRSRRQRRGASASASRAGTSTGVPPARSDLGRPARRAHDAGDVPARRPRGRDHVTADEAVGAGDGEAARHYFRAPGPFSARPGVAPVCSPSRRTGTPFTSTCRMPTAYWCGLS